VCTSWCDAAHYAGEAGVCLKLFVMLLFLLLLLRLLQKRHCQTTMQRSAGLSEVMQQPKTHA
jgi:hypothetical protein